MNLLKIFVFSFVILFTGCKFIDPGHVGIRVNYWGNQKGVEDYPLRTGMITYNPWSEDIYTFPTYMQNIIWSEDHAISFNSSEGATITASVGLAYTLERNKVPHLFVEFRQEIDVITETYLRNQVRDAFNRIGSKHKAIDIFGVQKESLLTEVKTELEKKLLPKGFIIDTISFTGSPTADARVMNSINSVIEATQKAIEAENKVKQITAEAEQSVAKSKGIAESRLLEAQAEADANKKITESLTPELIKYKMLEKWDGVAPRVVGGDAQLLLQLGDK